MGNKSRVSKLEQKLGGPVPTVVCNRTIYESKDGMTESETTRATLIWGDGRTALVIRAGNETIEAFRERLAAYKALSWGTAQKAGGLIFHRHQRTDRKD